MDLKKRNDKEWATLGIKGYVMLMIEFLRFSPSYELARRVHVRKPSDEEWQKVWFSEALAKLMCFNSVCWD